MGVAGGHTHVAVRSWRKRMQVGPGGEQSLTLPGTGVAKLPEGIALAWDVEGEWASAVRGQDGERHPNSDSQSGNPSRYRCHRSSFSKEPKVRLERLAPNEVQYQSRGHPGSAGKRDIHGTALNSCLVTRPHHLECTILNFSDSTIIS